MHALFFNGRGSVGTRRRVSHDRARHHQALLRAFVGKFRPETHFRIL